MRVTINDSEEDYNNGHDDQDGDLEDDDQDHDDQNHDDQNHDDQDNYYCENLFWRSPTLALNPPAAVTQPHLRVKNYWKKKITNSTAQILMP